MLETLPFSLSVLLVQVPECSKLLATTVQTTHPFGDDLSKLDSEMAELTELELLVEETNTTHASLIQTKHPLSAFVSPDGDIASTLFGATAPDGERLMDIPGFLWGFLLLLRRGFPCLSVY